MSGKNVTASRVNIINGTYPLNQMILFTALAILSCTFLPVGILSLLSRASVPVYVLIPAYALLASGVVFLFTVIRRSLYTFILSLSVFFIYSITGSPILPAIITAVLLSSLFCGYMCSVLGGSANWFLLLLPTLSYIGAYALCGDPVFSLLSLIPLSSGAVVGLLHKKKVDRKTVTVVSSAVLLCLISLFSALILYRSGDLNVTSINGLILSARDTAIKFMQSYTLTLGGVPIAVFDPELIELFIINFFNIIPAMAVCTAFIIIYVSHSLQIILYERTDFDLMISEKTSKIDISIYAAGVFLISYILSLSTDVAGNATLLTVVTKNLFIILVPGLFLSGIYSVGDMLKKKSSGGIIAVLFLTLAAFVFRQYIIQIVAAFGAVYIIITNIDSWAQKHYAKKQ